MTDARLTPADLSALADFCKGKGMDVSWLGSPDDARSSPMPIPVAATWVAEVLDADGGTMDYYALVGGKWCEVPL